MASFPSEGSPLSGTQPFEFVTGTINRFHVFPADSKYLLQFMKITPSVLAVDFLLGNTFWF